LVTVSGITTAIAVELPTEPPFGFVNYAYALLADGTVRNWLPSSSPTASPPVEGVTNATELACDGAHCCVRLASDDVICWGRNSDYELGDGTSEYRATPVPVLP
jgi:hypothetical protein